MTPQASTASETRGHSPVESSADSDVAAAEEMHGRTACVSTAHHGDELLLNGDEAARLLSVSRATFYRLNDKGLIPAPVHLGSVRRWSRRELRRWEAAGCPPRERWEILNR